MPESISFNHSSYHSPYFLKLIGSLLTLVFFSSNPGVPRHSYL